MIAQAKLKPRGAGLHFSVQDATSLPYADETFDAVLIANALHIMPRPEKALAEIYRVLKPGGQLFAPTFVHGEVPRTRLRMLAMRCAGLQIYNSWMVPQYLDESVCFFNISDILSRWLKIVGFTTSGKIGRASCRERV